jgi:outer membrane protein TolC
MSLEQAVAAALERYPSIRVSEAQVRSAAAAIDLARTSYLPKLDAIAGLNRASRNNVLGLMLPSQIIAPISGPVLNTNELASAWGSTVGLLFTWEPFDFGLRDANIALAEAGLARAQVGVGRTRLELATLAADSFLTVLAAQQTVTAANAAVERAAELQRITDALVKAELRPGAESSLARAEHASAQAQLIRARQAVGEAKASLAALVGAEPAGIGLETGKLLSMPPLLPGQSSLENNPLARDHDASIAETTARLHVLDKGYYPRFTVQGTTYARGTGALPDGQLLGGANGLGPNIHNWGLGFTVTFPIFEYAGLRARKSAENARLDVEKSRYQQILTDLKAKRDVAMAAYEGAVQITATTPIAIEAATAAVAQARARYQSGLGTALDVADAQRRLTQAEIDDGLARLNVWRARLRFYSAEGDISPLLKEASQ